MEPETPVRVLLADDHELLRAELRADLELDGCFTVVAEAGDGRDAVDAALRERPDLCLLDVHMPRFDGLFAATAIAEELPETKIVMLTASRDDEHALAALRAGAVGYLLKDVAAEGLAQALRDVLEGGIRFSRQLLSRLAPRERESGTPREAVRTLLEQGVPATEMPARLDVEPAVVRRELESLLGELRAAAASC